MHLRDVRVQRRFVTTKDRWVFLVLAAWALGMTGFMVADDTASQRVWGYPIWAVMLGLGGLSGAVFAVHMSSFRLRGLSAALMVVACTGRGCGLLLAVVNNTAHSVWSGMLGMGAWTMLGFLLYLTWRSRVPYHGGPDAWPGS